MGAIRTPRDLFPARCSDDALNLRAFLGCRLTPAARWALWARESRYEAPLPWWYAPTRASSGTSPWFGHGGSLAWRVVAQRESRSQRRRKMFTPTGRSQRGNGGHRSHRIARGPRRRVTRSLVAAPP